MRHYSRLDRLLLNVEQALRTVHGTPPATERPDPADAIAPSQLDEQAQKHAAGLMRINHVGEICAQALYQAQALTARDPNLQNSMARAADEENDHLRWCEARVKALNSHTSYLNPLWYAGSFAIGTCAGLAGDKWSLGFVAETERQVVKHLDSHLQQLHANDQQSRAVVEQMKEDEAKHATWAVNAGGAELPKPVTWLMQACSKVMTSAAYRI